MLLRSVNLFVLLPLGILAGCASARVEYAPISLEPASEVGTAPVAARPDLEVASTRSITPSAASDLDLADLELADLAFKGDGKIGKSYTQFKLGAFEGSGDLNGQDTGFWGEVVFGRELIPLLSVEASLGYLQSNGPLFDLWAIPLLINGRVQLPVLIFEIYGGVGVGGAYVDASGGGTSNDEFTWLGDAFLGAEVGVGNLAVGLEGRYLKASESSKIPTIEGTSLMLLLKLPF